MKKMFINELFLILISIIILILSYPKFSLWPLAWFSLIPAIIALYRAKNYVKAFLYGYLLGFTFYMCILYWIIPTMRAGGVNIYLSIFSLILLSAILAIEFGIIFLFSFKFKKFNSMAFSLIFASIWTIIEFLKVNATKFLIWFPWFSLAYTQWNNQYILPYAYYGGIYLISFIMIFFQTLIVSLYIKKEKKVKFIFQALLTIIIIILFNYFGLKISSISAKQEKISVVIIQPSIDFYKKWDKEYENWIKERIETLLSLCANENPDMILWPENALPGWIDDKEIFKWLFENIKKTKAFHIVGSISRIDGKYVSAFLISPESEIIAEYNKIVLVPFGEYVPLRNFLGKYINVIGSLGEFENGNINQPPFVIKNFKIGPSICYESIFNYLFYNQADKNSDFFVNITNDGWYLDTSAPYQHLAAAVLRAAENRKYLIRAANNGISAVISPYGKIEKKLGLNEYGIIKAEIPKIEASERAFPFSPNCIVYLSGIIILTFVLAMIFI